jgi:uncharacterized membrane protein YciS (DUF1049 family)
MTISWLNGGATMTEFQELMLYTCFGAMTGVFIAEIIVIIASAVSWVKDKIRNRKEARKIKESATKVE